MKTQQCKEDRTFNFPAVPQQPYPASMNNFTEQKIKLLETRQNLGTDREK